MQSISLNCDACGKKTHVEDGYVDRFKNVFCTKECYRQIDSETNCVSRYNVQQEASKEELMNIFYTCDTLQLATHQLKTGEKLDNEGKPEVHPSQTHALFLLQGVATITVYRDGEPWPMPLDGSVASGKTLIVIPPGVPHTIENKGETPVILMSIYSPPVEPTCL